MSDEDKLRQLLERLQADSELPIYLTVRTKTLRETWYATIRMGEISKYISVVNNVDGQQFGGLYSWLLACVGSSLGILPFIDCSVQDYSGDWISLQTYYDRVMSGEVRI